MPAFHEALEKVAADRFAHVLSDVVQQRPTRRPTGPPTCSGALEALEEYLLGEPPSLTRLQVAEQAGVPLEVANELWRLLGFPQHADDDVAFTPRPTSRRCG